MTASMNHHLHAFELYNKYPSIMGYHIYGFPHFTPVTFSPISCAHWIISVCTIYNKEEKWNVKNFQSMGEYL